PAPLAERSLGWAPPEAQAPPAPGGPSWWRAPLTKDGTSGPTGTSYLWGPHAGPFTKEPPRATAPGAPRGAVWTGGWTLLAAAVAATAG
ncbi:hypothetical protein ACSNOD_31970, partial [Streptomyces sp. URMC 123]